MHNPSLHPVQRWLFALVIGALLVSLAPPPRLLAQEPPPTYTFQECQQVEEPRLRDELNAITQNVFATEQSNLDIQRLVDQAWLELGLDAVVDREVERAIARVHSEEDYWSRFLSGWSADKAEELTTKVANYAFGSESFRNAVADLSSTVADDLADELGAMTAKSASSALLCVQEFIGDTFSHTMATVFEKQIQEKVADADLQVDANFTVVLDTHTKGLAGVGVIIGTQIAKRLATQIAERIAGRVVGRILGKAATSIIPLAGWIIGGGLIIWDLIEAGEGALPQIQESLQGPDVKASIRAQIAETVRNELKAETPELARSVSNDVYSEWLDFRKRFARVLDLASSNPRFQSLLDHSTADQVDKLAELVAVADEALDPEVLAQTIDSGLFERLFYLPAPAFEILRTTHDPQVVAAWADLAGESIVQVTSTELYKVASPDQFTNRSALERVLALEDTGVILEIMALNQLERETLLALPPERVRALSNAFDADDLSWIAGYIAEMPPEESNLLVDRIVREPALMPKLKFEDIHRAIVESENVQETLDFLTTQHQEDVSPVAQVTQVVEDTQRAVSGDVPWLLFWRKYASWRNGLILVAGLLFLYTLVRVLFRRREPNVSVTVNLPDSRDERS